jgi:Fe-coproporphyrin III synthase
MGLFKGLIGEFTSGIVRETNHLRPHAMYSMGFLTYRCTSRCRTCNIWKRGEEGSASELSREQWLAVIDKLQAYGIKSFEIFGGDALLREDAIFDVISSCRNKGIETYFPTNSIRCDQTTVRRLVESGLDTVYLSLDEVGYENDGIRGVDGAFERVKDTLEAFVAERGDHHNPAIIVCTTISSMNYRSFLKILDFIEQYPVNAIYPRPLGEFDPENVRKSEMDGFVPEPYFASSDGESHLLSDSQVKEMRMLFSELKLRKSGVYVSLQNYYLLADEAFTKGTYPVCPCHVASLLVTINPNGDVVPCPFFRSYVIGNLVKHELDSIWGNEMHRKFLDRQQKGQLPICSNCNMRLYYPSMREQFSYYSDRAMEKLGVKSL